MTEKKILAELKGGRKEQAELRQDIDDLAIVTKNSFDRVDAQFTKVDKRFDGVENKIDTVDRVQKELRSDVNRIERGVKAILEVVQENNILLKEFRTHPERIARVEKRLFK